LPAMWQIYSSFSRILKAPPANLLCFLSGADGAGRGMISKEGEIFMLNKEFDVIDRTLIAGSVLVSTMIGGTMMYFTIPDPAFAVTGATMQLCKLSLLLCVIHPPGLPPLMRAAAIAVIVLVQALIEMCIFAVTGQATASAAVPMWPVFRWLVVGMAMITDPMFMAFIFLSMTAAGRSKEA
jgi:hypothetical protein